MTQSRRELADAAIDLVMPAIQNLVEAGFTGGRKNLHIIVAETQRKEPQLIVERSIGNPKDWSRDYAQIARSKVFQAIRTGQPNVVAHAMDSVSLNGGDTVYYGSFVLGSVAVAASGLQPWFDQMVSGWVAIAYQQLIQDEVQRWKAAYPEADFFPNDFLPV